MELYILRHAIAEPAEDPMPDSDRALTTEGKRALRRVLRRAKAAGVEPSLILTSPYTRAKQTAEIALAALNPSATLEESKTLLPSAAPGEACSLLRRCKQASVMVVGHEPHLGHLAGLLLGVPGLRIALKKSAAIRIDVDPANPSTPGELRWMLTNAIA